VAVVHDVPYMFSQAYWNDESWVAVTTRFPLSDLAQTTSSTPIGFSFLVRLLTIGRSQSARVLVLAFAGMAVIVAYWFARRLEWKSPQSSVLAAALAACGVLVVPAMLLQDDLKQYAADACMSLVILAVLSRLERQWSYGGLAALSVALWGGMFFSHTAAFVGAVAWLAVCLVQLARRRWRRLLAAALFAAASAGLAIGVYELFDVRAVVPGLTDFWHSFYLTPHDGWLAAYYFVTRTGTLIRIYFGLGPVWLAIPLVVAGLVTLFRLGRPATATAVVLLWPEMLGLSALKRYPFLELRTSTFLIVITVVVAAIGVAGICSVLRTLLRRGRVAQIAVFAVSGCALAFFTLHAWPFVRNQNSIPFSPIRIQTQYIGAHAGPKDPIVLSANSNWGFAYYWTHGQPGVRVNQANLQRYQADFPGQGRIVVTPNRTLGAIQTAIATAVNKAPNSGCPRVWLVLTQLDAVEKAGFPQAIRNLHLHSVGLPNGVVYIQLGPPSCQPARRAS
jgi:hypothetical protein